MSAERDALVRLVAALAAWDAEVLQPKVDLERSRVVDFELRLAREEAERVVLASAA